MATSAIRQPAMKQSFKVTTISATYSIASGYGVAKPTASGTESGWTPIAIVGAKYGSNVARAYTLVPTFSYEHAQVVVDMKNVSSSGIGDKTMEIKILWAR